ncbi:acyltransferase domain-containing protein [Paenibacillus silvisoli]|uniref:acyltransferase domain-containing protein n=1 Tax=Paenibacillus silvisoli TaxID=3110539 RepID=UPI0028057427|nr:acyltransferase domain-containing protein [Paenibacillus silvisoli]
MNGQKQRTIDELWFLQEEALLEANRLAQLPAGALDALLTAAETVRQDEGLSSLALRGHRLLFQPELTGEADGETFSGILSAMGEGSELYQPIILLSGLPRLEGLYAEKGIPQEILIHTLSDMALWMNDYYGRHSRWGLGNEWLVIHLSFRLFRVGRLQFERTGFGGGVRVLRHRESREVLALAESGSRYRADGLVDGTNDRYDEAGAWEAVLEEDDQSIRGHRIDAGGFANRAAESFRAEEWETVLRKGDPVLSVHIAADGKMDHAQCLASMENAIAFFKRHFPEEQRLAFACTSWLLDPQFGELLDGASNIVRFQREFQLYPVGGEGKEGLRRIFGSLYDDWSTAPRDTSLRRAVLDHLAGGGALRDMGGFIMM